MSARPRILIVDDSPESLLALRSTLARADAELVAVSSGREAMARLLREEFAVVLLDVVMPDFGGFEVAELIRSNAPSQHTPIIFLTGLGPDQRMEFAGYEKGAVDYLLKPVDPVILRSKVDVFLRLFEQSRALSVLAEWQHTQAELSRVHQDLERFVAGVFHDLQEPARSVALALDCCREELAERLDPESARWLETAAARSARLLRMLQGLREYVEAGRSDDVRVPIELGDTLRAVVESRRGEIRAVGARVEIGELPRVSGSPSQLHVLFAHLLDNALKFSHPERSPEIEVHCERRPADAGEMARIHVVDNGLGIGNVEKPERLFEVFSHLRRRDTIEGAHLGLAVCRRIAEAHAGSIAASAHPRGGTDIAVDLPVVTGADEKEMERG